MLGDPQVLKDRALFQNLSREHSELSKILTVYRAFKATVREL